MTNLPATGIAAAALAAVAALFLPMFRKPVPAEANPQPHPPPHPSRLRVRAWEACPPCVISSHNPRLARGIAAESFRQTTLFNATERPTFSAGEHRRLERQKVTWKSQERRL